jgi:hypothetical protein
MHGFRPLSCLIIVSGIGRAAEEDWRWELSGHARTMAESYENIDFGLGPVDDDTWVHQRVQAMVTAEKNDWLEVAAELTWGRMWGKKQPLAPPDQDDADLLQGFVQSRIPLAGGDLLEIRAGRQDLYYGSGRLLASREGANQRLAHDALRFSWQRPDDFQVDAFIASPVAIGPDAFDNRSHPSDIRFWSLYATSSVSSHGSVDLYYIGLRDDESVFTANGGHETRHTTGFRYWSDGDPFICDTEGILQFGDADGRDILAGALSLGIGRMFSDFRWKPSLVLRADAISGGDDRGKLNTFDPLFQANNYFNEGGFISPSNLYNLNPRLVLIPSEEFTVNLGVNFQWRFSPADSVYGPTLDEIGGPAPDGQRYLGTVFNLSVEWTPDTATSVFLGYTHQDAGDSLTSIGGGDVEYLQLSMRRSF